MLLNPRYEADNPALCIDSTNDSIRQLLVQQRERLLGDLAQLSEVQWQRSSRCAGWNIQDVVLHLVATDEYWSRSITAGIEGTPTRLLTQFDPAVTPDRLVSAARGESTYRTLSKLSAAISALEALLAKLPNDLTGICAESPLGWVPVDLALTHALWDGWVHERDVLLPLDRHPLEVEDEVGAVLAYAVALGPALVANSHVRTNFCVHAYEPSVHLLVEIGDRVVVTADAGCGDVRLSGRAVTLIEALAQRTPFPSPLEPRLSAMLTGLGVVFDGEA